jgi:hypothetical protein
MTTRERWIVYPLIFLSLGVALRDKILLVGGNPRLHFQAGDILAGQISCSELNVLAPNGKPVVVAGAEVKTYSGLLETKTAKGEPLVQLRSNESGGFVTAIGRGGRIGLMGHTPQDFGLYVKTPLADWAIPIFVWPGHYKIEKKAIPAPTIQPSTPPQENETPKKTENTPPKEGQAKPKDLSMRNIAQRSMV